jgi:hypothetical protein
VTALLDAALSTELLSMVAGHPVREPLSIYHTTLAAGRPDKHLLFLAEPGAAYPFALVKWARGGAAAGLQREQAALAQMRTLPDAVLTASCPPSWGPFAAGPDTWLSVDRYLPARSAYAQLRMDWWPRRLVTGHFARATTWLTHFAQATRQSPQPLDDALLETYIVAPLTAFAARFGPVAAPPDALAATLAAARAQQGQLVRLTAEHGDLWLANLLLARGTSLYVIDWEHFRPAALPGFDMLLFCTTYAMDFPWRPFGLLPPADTIAPANLHPTWLTPHIGLFLTRLCAAYGLPPALLPVLLPVLLARMALRQAEAAPDGALAPSSSWLAMLCAWWARPADNWLDAWARSATRET